MNTVKEPPKRIIQLIKRFENSGAGVYGQSSNLVGFLVKEYIAWALGSERSVE